MPTIISGDYEWDESKAVANLAKHGVSFVEAAEALCLDPNDVSYEDVVYPERVLSLAMSPLARVLLVVTTERGTRTRILSARKANTHEQRRYENGV